MRDRGRRSIHRFMLAGPCALALGLVGCQVDSTAREPIDTRRADLLRATDQTSARIAPGEGVAARSPEELTLQAERDIAFLQQHRMNQTARPVGDLPDTLPPAPTETAAAPPEIDWNGPPARAVPDRRTRPTTPPLGRDPAPNVDVRAMQAAPEPVTSPPRRAGLTEAERETARALGLRLVELRRDLLRESIDSEQPVRELILIAATSLLDSDLQMPEGTNRHLTPEEQAIVNEMHAFFVRLSRDLEGGDASHESLIEAVHELEASLDRTPPLELPTAALCWRIGGFGDYDRFEHEKFLAHSEQDVILYLEITGFASELNPKRQWVTEISQQLEIYSDADGIPVWSEPWQKAVDRTNNQRRDFFTHQIIKLPKALSVGRYHLKVRVRDEKSGAEAETSVPFEMVADPKLAAKVGKRRGG